jgi:hypothetical protein
MLRLFPRVYLCRYTGIKHIRLRSTGGGMGTFQKAVRLLPFVWWAYGTPSREAESNFQRRKETTP